MWVELTGTVPLHKTNPARPRPLLGTITDPERLFLNPSPPGFDRPPLCPTNVMDFTTCRGQGFTDIRGDRARSTPLRSSQTGVQRICLSDNEDDDDDENDDDDDKVGGDRRGWGGKEISHDGDINVGTGIIAFIDSTC